MKRKAKDTRIIIIYLLPALVLFALFIIYPIINAVQLSFGDWGGIYGAPSNFIGFRNYIDVFTSRVFWNSMLNALYFMIGGFLILMPLAFGLGLLVTSKLKGTKLMKTMYFMPVMLTITAVALMWGFILQPGFGALNEALRAVGLDALTRGWLTEPTLNVWMVILVNTWMFAGYNMLIFAAGLVAIPDSLYEAAAIDGCSGLRKIWYISIPLTKESFKIFAILCITGCLRAFDIVFAMTSGGPNRVSEMPATLLYNNAFVFRQFGAGNSIGVILLILGVSLSIMVNKIFSREKE